MGFLYYGFMGLFQVMKYALLRRRLKATFRDHIDPDLIDYVLDPNRKPIDSEPKIRPITFVFVRVREGSFESMQRLTSVVVDAASDKGAFVENCDQAYIKCGFNLLDFKKPPCPEDPAGLLEAINAAVGPDVAVIHGVCDARVGDFGIPRRSSFGAHLPYEQRVVRELMNMPIGEVRQVAPDSQDGSMNGRV